MPDISHQVITPPAFAPLDRQVTAGQATAIGTTGWHYRLLYRLCAFALFAWCLQVPCGMAETLTGQGGRRLELDISEQFDGAQRDAIVHWIGDISHALERVYGHWPEPLWRVVVQPASGASDDVIPWAQVHRGRIDTVEYFVLRSADPQQLNRAWTAYHELAHLLIPYRGWGDIWFSEGLASYYQNLLRARIGVLDEQAMWQKLHEGFMRGRNDHEFDGQSLERVSGNMRHAGGFMRVYWSGAWYFLAADIALRQSDTGPGSLDLALKQLNHCCADDELSVMEMVALLDELNGVELFSPLYKRARSSTSFPDFESLYRVLGISLKGDRVQLSQGDEAARMRRQMLEFPKL